MGQTATGRCDISSPGKGYLHFFDLKFLEHLQKIMQIALSGTTEYRDDISLVVLMRKLISKSSYGTYGR